MSEIVRLDDVRPDLIWKRYLKAKEAYQREQTEEAMLALYRALYQWRDAMQRKAS